MRARSSRKAVLIRRAILISAVAALPLCAAPSTQRARAASDTPVLAQGPQNLPVPFQGTGETGNGNPFAPVTNGAQAASPPGAGSALMRGSGFYETDLGDLAIADLADFARPVLRAQISPRRQTVLSAEISGKIATFPLREGERFAEGDPLVGFDCAVHIARRDRARAQERSARRRLETAGRLDALSSISRLEYDETVAALAVAEAETTLSEIAVSRCTIAAPFPGRVAERLAEPFQYVAEGEPVISILDDRDLEVALMVPSRWLAWLRPGHTFEMAIDELESTLEASVSRIGARVDPVSQSIRIFAAITRAPSGIMAGMSGEARLRPPAPEAGAKGAP